MLSRVANHIYWMARYLERAENTARLIQVNTHLLLDLPKNVTLGWEPIIDMLSFRDNFYERYSQADERSVIKFMVTDSQTPGSIINSLAYARENARIIRDIIPSESWEQINNLHLTLKEDGQSVLTRRHRFECLNRIITGNQSITGLFGGTMNRDDGYAFLRLGRHLERADMTTRIIDVRSASLLPDMSAEHSAFENIQWMGVLKSLTAYQMYRQEMRLRVNRADILEFLMKRAVFPRSLMHSVMQLNKCMAELPNRETVCNEIQSVASQLEELDTRSLKQARLHEVIDDIQAGLMNIHNAIDEAYF
ncbi:alpha-E domain-containing protein [Alteromonas aestuariivivens]|uniref:Alpha-E domain-containing protein n=1 Tax=Alteromonas aestuariivivens TaxID=1938339 RepID=A0A3D8M808_9ALTE|nr:alpha-E domain-containing protein [Alteromonas aestuariivivens]RDV25954.1 alpha-E domain-containing protein [Alteromonas aestuariivivens]